MLDSNLSEAGNRQMINIRLKTVIGSNNKKEFENYFKQIERTGIATYEEIANTVYNLLSAGLNGEDAMKGAEKVIKVAKITGGQSDLVASTMATASKNFNISMDRVGDVLAKTQLKFQFANFGQLSAGFDLVGASASAIKLPLEQTATLLGILNDAGITGSNAGTSLNAVLRQMGVASKKLGIEITRSADGSLDLVGFLKQIDNKTKGFNLDKKAQIFQEIFGDEGKKGLLPLIANLDKMSINLKEVGKDSEGIVDKEIVDFLSAYNTQTTKLSNAFKQLSAVLGNIILPLATKLISIFADTIFYIVYLIDQYKSLGWIINAVAIGLGILATRMLILRTLGIINWIFGISKAFAFLRTAIILTTGAIRSMSVAMLFTPMGIFMSLVAVATLIISNWEIVKSWFIDFFNWLSNNGFFKMLDKGITIAKNAISNEGVNKVREASKLGSNLSSNNTSNNQTYNINVTGANQPIDTAKEVSREISKVEQLSLIGG